MGPTTTRMNGDARHTERKGRGELRTSWGWAGLVFLVAFVVAGCSLDGLLKSDQLPPDVSDPAATQTAAGALTAYYGTLAQFRVAENSFVRETGLLTDELLNVMAGAVTDPMDQRDLPNKPANSSNDPSGQLYNDLNRVRGQASQAIGLVARYAPDRLALEGHLYALQGYAEVMLAELYCSGIPLSTVDFDSSFTYRPGSSTDAVLAHAVALFDTALTLTGDSARLADLARIGRARALLGRGVYADAAAAVAAVADGYHYDVIYALAVGTVDTFDTRNFTYIATTSTAHWSYTVADREGFNGLNWGASGDPRSQVTQKGSATTGFGAIPIYYPNKYFTNGSTTDGGSPIVLASGVEARLIGAEAALQSGDTATWLATLNALRTDGTFDTTVTSSPDTLWHAGTGGMAGLKPLADPGTAAGRVDLLFRERAFWLFLTGHRQGDLRRLIRQYGRIQDNVYPVGTYQGTVGFGTAGSIYGADITAPVPLQEVNTNPLYTGCISRDA